MKLNELIALLDRDTPVLIYGISIKDFEGLAENIPDHLKTGTYKIKSIWFSHAFESIMIEL